MYLAVKIAHTIPCESIEMKWLFQKPSQLATITPAAAYIRIRRWWNVSFFPSIVDLICHVEESTYVCSKRVCIDNVFQQCVVGRQRNALSQYSIIENAVAGRNRCIFHRFFAVKQRLTGVISLVGVIYIYSNFTEIETRAILCF